MPYSVIKNKYCDVNTELCIVNNEHGDVVIVTVFGGVNMFPMHINNMVDEPITIAEPEPEEPKVNDQLKIF